MPRPDPSAGPWAELACQLHDELYEPKGRPAVKAMARGMHISTGSVSNVLKGEKGSHWDSLGRSVVRYFGGDSSDTGIWATRWAAAAERQRKRQANDGIEPLPWLDDDEVRQAASEQAVRDWDRNRLAPVTRRWRSRVAVIAAAASVTTAAAMGWWLLATVLLVPLLALMVGPTIVHRARRRADPRSWRRRIILGPVGDRVRDLLRDHDEAPVTQQLVLLDQVTHTEDLTKEMTYPEGTGVLGPYDESGQTLYWSARPAWGRRPSSRCWPRI